MGYNNIHIINNGSTYPPLLDYYKNTKYKVHNLERNLGYKALWLSDIFNQFRNDYYVYTDADVVPANNCPDDFLNYFMQVMKKYPKAQKVGFSLIITDLPDCFKDKDNVIYWENRFWQNELSQGLYNATIDTTFALYRPWTSGSANFIELNIRTGEPYIARHLPWYEDSDLITSEQEYYKAHLQAPTHWSKNM